MEALSWVIAVMFILFWLLPIAILAWVVWEVVRRRSRPGSDPDTAPAE